MVYTGACAADPFPPLLLLPFLPFTHTHTHTHTHHTTRYMCSFELLKEELKGALADLERVIKREDEREGKRDADQEANRSASSPTARVESVATSEATEGSIAHVNESAATSHQSRDHKGAHVTPSNSIDVVKHKHKHKHAPAHRSNSLPAATSNKRRSIVGRKLEAKKDAAGSQPGSIQKKDAKTNALKVAEMAKKSMHVLQSVRGPI
jgi:hypothetical protein